MFSEAWQQRKPMSSNFLPGVVSGPRSLPKLLLQARRRLGTSVLCPCSVPCNHQSCYRYILYAPPLWLLPRNAMICINGQFFPYFLIVRMITCFSSFLCSFMLHAWIPKECCEKFVWSTTHRNWPTTTVPSHSSLPRRFFFPPRCVLLKCCCSTLCWFLMWLSCSCERNFQEFL